jgi:Ni/Co efflux regulator RcnB
MQRLFSTLSMVITGGLLLTAVVAVPLQAQAQQPGPMEHNSDGYGDARGNGYSHSRGHEKGHDQDRNRDQDDRGHKRWQSDETSIIKGFFSEHWSDGTPRGKAMPPGLAKQGKIPPGMAAQIRQGKRLPDGLGRALPPSLTARLPKRAGVRPLIVGDDLVLVDAVSRVIVDILRGAAR